MDTQLFHDRSENVFVRPIISIVSACLNLTRSAGLAFAGAVGVIDGFRSTI